MLEIRGGAIAPLPPTGYAYDGLSSKRMACHDAKEVIRWRNPFFAKY